MPIPDYRRQAGAVTFAELTAGLIWPNLLRAFPLAIHPARLIIGLLVVLACSAIGAIVHAGVGADLPPADTLAPAASTPGGENPLKHVVDEALVHTDGAVLLHLDPANPAVSINPAIGRFISDHPVATVILMLLCLPVIVIGGAAISRMVAVDFAGDLHMGVAGGLRFAMRRIVVLLESVLIPVIFILIGLLGMAVGGWILLSLPGVDVVGALVYGVFLFGALLIALAIAGFIVGGGMLIPAVVVEGTDAMDAIQRTYAYTLGRPGRLLGYLFILALQAVIAIPLMALLRDATLAIAGEATTWFAPAAAERLAGGGVAASILDAWRWIVHAIFNGFLVAYLFAQMTLLYMLLRRVNDQQDVHEIWMPGMIGGTMSPIEPMEDDAGPIEQPEPEPAGDPEDVARED